MIFLMDMQVMLLDVVYFILCGCLRIVMRPRTKDISGELVLITGAGGGLGRLFALDFVEEGAEVVLWDINAKTNEETAKLVREAGGKAYTYMVDVTNRAEVYKTADQVRKDLGRDVTFLVNNAGVVAGYRFLDCPDDMLERTMKVNCHAHFWTLKAFLPQMMANNHGHIVTIASVLGLYTTACVEDYCASKFAAVGLHESMTHELLTEEKYDGVKTTLVCPYLVDNEMFEGCKIRDEAEVILPAQDPVYVVKQAMNAVLIDQRLVCIPRLTYMPYMARTVLPWDASLATYRFVESDKCMVPFIERKQQKANGAIKAA